MYQITTVSGRGVELDARGGLLHFSFGASPGKNSRNYTFQGCMLVYDNKLDGCRLNRIAYRRSDSSRDYTEVKPAMRDRWPDLWREIEGEIVPAIRDFTRGGEYAAEREAWLRDRRVHDIQRKEDEIARRQAALADAHKELAQLRGE